MHLTGCASVYAQNSLTLPPPTAFRLLTLPTTAKWGDIVGSFNSSTQSYTPPNGVVDFSDINAIVARFQNSAIAPLLTQCDLAPAVPNGVVDFSDIAACVDGFQSKPYPYPAASMCP